MDLTKEQESMIISFLKRWGIESPDLLVEMTDHYCELAGESMNSGMTFEEALQSWKTKKNYLALRRIQSRFETSFKKQWLKAHLDALKAIFTTKQVFLLVAFGALIHLLYRLELGAWVSGFFLIKAAVSILVILYFITARKKYNRVWEMRRSMVFWFGHYFIIADFIASDGYTGEDPFTAHQLLIYLILIFDLTTFNLWSEIQKAYRGIIDEYFVEPQIPSRS